jgi:manganese transport protein
MGESHSGQAGRSLDIAFLYSDGGAGKSLIAIQIVLSPRLPFALVPLIRFTADRTKTGGYTNARWLNVLVSIVAGMIIAFDLRLIAGARQ